MSVSEADEILEESPESEPIEVIQQTYQTYFIDSGARFNRTLFRFLLNRLGKQADDFASDHCHTLLEEHPDETDAILDYLSSVGPVEVYGIPVMEFSTQDVWFTHIRFTKYWSGFFNTHLHHQTN